MSLPSPGSDYKGTVSHTVSGRECLRWDEQSYCKGCRGEDENYCRNPDEDSRGVWCFVDGLDENDNTYYEHCSQIEDCPGECHFPPNRFDFKSN